ncbi:hypothetical protein KKE92_03225 [Candidatus Micrarchaeota archaeon]|nr:hypothetical protein [Candidatus Micrarchaeota archaeon]MBU1681641.1 hypothetical protein [Candidatus Micrarchaeota archaeon]
MKLSRLQNQNRTSAMKKFATAAVLAAGLLFSTTSFGQTCPTSVVYSRAGQKVATTFESAVLKQDHSKTRRLLGASLDTPVEARSFVQISKSGHVKTGGIAWFCGTSGSRCAHDLELQSWESKSLPGIQFSTKIIPTESGCKMQISTFVPVIDATSAHVPADSGIGPRPVKSEPTPAETPREKISHPKRTPLRKVRPVTPTEQLPVARSIDPRTAEEAELDVVSSDKMVLDTDGYISHRPSAKQLRSFKMREEDPSVFRDCASKELTKSGFTWASWSIYRNKVRPMLSKIKQFLGESATSLRVRSRLFKGGAQEVLEIKGICGDGPCRRQADFAKKVGISIEPYILEGIRSNCEYEFDLPLAEDRNYGDFKNSKMLVR